MNKRLTVLVIEDEKVNIMIIKTILEQEGFCVLDAENGKLGRELAEESRPDLILLDIRMSVESGFETCEKLKANAKTSNIPIIFITALSDVKDKVKGFNLGAVDYITKPFEDEEVIARVKLHIKLNYVQRAIIKSQSERLKQITKAQQEILINPGDLPEANFFIEYRPIMEAGGDFYDVIKFGEDIFAYFCADVSGHDIGSSLATSALKALIHQNAGPLYSPSDTMQLINSVLKTVLINGKFLTIAYALLNKNKNQLLLVSAGHPPVIYMRKEKTPEIINISGDIIGAFEHIYIETKKIKVETGDRFFLYTDGFIESFKKKKNSREENIETMRQIISNTKDLSIEKAVKYIANTLFPENTTPEDDLLLLGIEI